MLNGQGCKPVWSKITTIVLKASPNSEKPHSKRQRKGSSPKQGHTNSVRYSQGCPGDVLINNDLTVHHYDHCNFYCDINDKSVSNFCTCIEIHKYIKCSCIVTDKCESIVMTDREIDNNDIITSFVRLAPIHSGFIKYWDERLCPRV